MRCDECQPLIEELVDNELDERQAMRVRTHMTSCMGCVSLYKELCREKELYGRYQRDIEISPAMWTSVLARIEREDPVANRPRNPVKNWFVSILRTPLMSPAFAAALVAIAIAATVVVMKYNNGTGKGPGPGDNQVARIDTPTPSLSPVPPTPSPAPLIAPTPGSVATTPPVGPVIKDRVKAPGNPNAPAIASRQPVQRPGMTPPSTMTTEQAVRAAEQSYLAAIALLTRDIKRNESQLDPAVQSRFKETLATIDRTIEETRKAVREHPGDAVAAQYLLAAYQDKVEVLKEIASAQ